MKKTSFLIGMAVICGFAVLLFINKKDLLNDVAFNKVMANKTPTPVAQNGENKSGFVQTEYHPIIFAFKEKNGVYSRARLLGGTKDGKWVQVENQEVKVGGQILDKDCMNLPGSDGKKDVYAEMAMVKGGETYRFYSFNKYLAESEGNRPVIWINGDTGDRLFDVGFKPLKGNNDTIFGINAQWNPLPRTPQKIDAKTFTIDMDNDGKEEKITREEKKTEDEGATYISYIVKRNNKVVAKGEYNAEGGGSQIYFLDLNGDNKMELIISDYGDANELSVYELKGDSVANVLNYYCGT